MADESDEKRRIQPEMLVGVSAVLIGLCALGVSLYETSLMREEQRAAALPLVELGRSYFVTNNDDESGQWRLQLHAENVGIGPARIRDFRVTVDGQPQTSWRAAVNALLGRDTGVDYGQSSINGRTVPPERTVRMFDLSTTALAAEIYAEFERLNFTACYCSIFDECWTTSYADFGAAKPVDSCERDETSFAE